MSKPPFLIFFTLLGVVSSTKNVLVITSAVGSHQYFSAEVATIIAEQGHNVTLLSLMPDARVNFDDRPFSDVFITGPEYMGVIEKMMRDWMTTGVLHLPTEAGVMAMIDVPRDIWNRMLAHTADVLLPYFHGGGFEQLLESVPFDLIVVEEFSFLSSKIQLTKAGIPVIGVSAVAEVIFPRVRDNNPMLLNSEPNPVNTIIHDTPPSLSDRLQGLKNVFKMAVHLGGAFNEILRQYYEETGVAMEQSDQVLWAHLTYDHPALSFPFLTPPYMFHMGFFHLDGVPTKPLSEEITKFTEGCAGEVIYMSFGSYVEDITIFPFVGPMLRGLAAVKPGVCLILKTKQDLSEIAPGLKVLQLSWTPQKDLLASGKVSMFISHCGNNGRMESIFYGVPILCVPLFGDQYYNARMVERRQFGRLIAKETITEEALRADVEEFLGRAEGYRANIAAAREFVKADPSSGREMFLFICEHVLNGGDLSFLKNKILQQQGMVEVYNLDILGVGMAVVALVTGLVLWVVWKCLRCTCRRVMKLKTE